MFWRRLCSNRGHELLQELKSCQRPVDQQQPGANARSSSSLARAAKLWPLSPRRRPRLRRCPPERFRAAARRRSEARVLTVLRQNLVTIDIVDFLRPSATLYRYEGITILAVLLFQSNTQRAMQFGF